MCGVGVMRGRGVSQRIFRLTEFRVPRRQQQPWSAKWWHRRRSHRRSSSGRPTARQLRRSPPHSLSPDSLHRTDTSQCSTITGQADRAHATLTACSTLSQNKTRPNTVHKVIQRAPASREAAMQQEKKKQTQHILTLTLSKRRTVERGRPGEADASLHTHETWSLYVLVLYGL